MDRRVEGQRDLPFTNYDKHHDKININILYNFIDIILSRKPC
jgi:hypothetical protein